MLNFFKCSNKIKKLRDKSEENSKEKANSKIINETPKNSHLKKFNTPSEKRLKQYLQNETFNDTNNQSDFFELKEPKTYMGNCLVKMNNYFYDLNQISPSSEK